MGYQKTRGEFWKLFCLTWEGSKWLTLGKEEFVWGTRGREKLYRLTRKWTSSKKVVKDFPYNLNAPSTDCFNFTASDKKCLFLIFLIFLFGSPLSVMRHNFSILFHLKLYMLWTSPSKFKLLDLQLLAWKLIKFLVTFQTTSHFFLNIASPFTVMTHNSSVAF